MRKVIAGAVLGILMLSVPAEAHTKTFLSTVQVQVLPTTTAVPARGQVLSIKEQCYVGRTVQIFKIGVSAAVAQAVTVFKEDGVGEWTVSQAFATGDYRVVIAPFRIKKTSRHTHRCTGGEAQYSVTSS